MWIVALLLCIAAWAPVPRAQLPTLSADMVAVYDPHLSASPLAMTVVSSSGSVILRAGFNNSGPTMTVDLFWGFGTPTTEWHTRHQAETVSFSPTAIAARAGTSDRIYVAGWNERLSTVVVEEWIFSGIQVLGPPMTPGWEPEDAVGVEPVFAAPQIQRNLLLACDSLQPILDITCNLNGEQLLLLERTGDSARAIHSFPLQGASPRCDGLSPATAGTPAVVLDSGAVPELAGTYSFWQGLKNGTGFFVFVSARQAWKPFPYKTHEFEIVLLRDANLDGVLEDLSVTTMGALFDTHSYEAFNFEYS